MTHRCDEPGWVMFDRPDGRRGAWVRVTGDRVEWCWGREGDDGYHAVTDHAMALAMRDVIRLLLWAREETAARAADEATARREAWAAYVIPEGT